MHTNQKVLGVVQKFLFQNSDDGFAIFILEESNKTKVVAKGYIPNIQLGQEIAIIGNWVTHPKFGRQFDVKECQVQLPTTLVGLKKYLGSGLIKGIGPVYAEKLVTHFGLDILNIIDQEPFKLKEISGIGQKRIEQIAQAWQEQKEISNLMVFLQSHNIGSAIAIKIYKKYKNNSVDVLQENPYRLAEEVWGIGFKIADDIALKLGFDKNGLPRVSAGIVYAIGIAAQSGHLYVEFNELRKKTIELLSLDLDEQADIIKNAFHTLYNKDKIKLLKVNNINYITLSTYYLSEVSVAERLKLLISNQTNLTFDIDKIYQNLRNQEDKLQLNEDQQRGIISCLKNKVSIITGGPGTGKTTLIKKLLSILDAEKVDYKLASPTGRAAKRIIESTGRFATTIHRLLEFDVSTMNFTYNKSNALKLDYLIVDECSMVDIFLASALLKALPNKAHLVLIGDVDQLPPVGAGNFLKDSIESKKIATVKLTQIFRQAQDSLIVINAHKVNNGEFPTSISENAKKDFMFIKEESPQNITDYLKRILFIELRKHKISLEDTIVLTPMNKGEVGTQVLNNVLQQMLNPNNGSPELSHGAIKFRVGDRVMQIRNNYNKHVYNGDIGIINNINLEDKNLEINFSDKPVSYEFDELNEIVLAYAISIHKSQGSEYSSVIVPIFMQHFMLLQRNLIYTALTRAKKLCIFIGQPKALHIALANTKGSERTTFLNYFLNNDII